MARKKGGPSRMDLRREAEAAEAREARSGAGAAGAGYRRQVGHRPSLRSISRALRSRVARSSRSLAAMSFRYML